MSFHEFKVDKNAEFPFEILINTLIPGVYDVKDHWHECFEMLLFTEGKTKAFINNVELVAQKGDLVFINSNDVHGFEAMEDSTIFVLKFMPFMINLTHPFFIGQKLLKGSVRLSQSKTKVNQLDYSQQSEIIEIMEDMLREYEKRELGYRIIIRGLIYKLLGKLIRYSIIVLPHLNMDEFEQERMSKAIEYINHNYMNDIPLSELAKHLNLSYSYMSANFKKMTGMSYKQYVNYVRVDKAEQQILCGKDTLLRIACNCGFHSLESFSRAYKKIRGYSPSSIKKPKKP